MKNWAYMGGTLLIGLVAACSAGTEDGQTGTLSAAETTATNADAEQTSDGDAGRPHRGPPPEAFTACEGKAAGDTCTVSTPDGKTIDGTCADPPPDAQDTRLACRPNGPPPDGNGGPPGSNGGGCDGKGPPPASSPSGSASSPAAS